MYSVKLHRKAAKEFARLPRSVQESIADLIDDIRKDPFNGARKLKLSPRGNPVAFRRRTGDYRVIYSINGNELMVLIIAIGDRKNVYQSIKFLK